MPLDGGADNRTAAPAASEPEPPLEAVDEELEDEDAFDPLAYDHLDDVPIQMRSTQPLSRQERQRRSLDDVPLQFRTNRIDQLTESITSRLRKVKPSVEPPTKKARASEVLNVSLELDAETLDSEPGVKLQEVFLTGKAAQKEIKYCDLSPPQRVLMLKAMAKEWDKWNEFKA